MDDKQFAMWQDKRTALLNGALAQQAQWPEQAHEYACRELASIAALLTSPEKYQREDGKSRVRQLVKLGKEAGK